ncbi:MAG: porin [Myxococcaceae bacterium]
MTVRTSGDRFRVNLRARIQAQANTSFPAPGGADSFRADQFLIRRARIALRASYDEAWELYVQLGVATSDVDPEAPSILRDGVITWKGLRDLNIRAGQTKIPFDRQRLTSSSALQMVDRSLITGELNIDRDVGIQATSDDFLGLGGRLHYALGVFGGDGRNRIVTRPGLLYVAKASYRPFGSFDETESDLAFEPSPKVAVSIAGARNIRSSRERSTIGPVYRLGTVNYWHAMMDAQLKWRGFSFLAAALIRRADNALITNDALGLWEFSRSGWGYFAQSGYLFLTRFEVVARFGELRPFDDMPGFSLTREIGAGLNWYAMKHNLKIQVDYHYVYFPGGPGGRHQARVQGQMYF